MTQSANRIALPAKKDGHREVEFSADPGLADRVHHLEWRDIHAINAAIAAGRPLLVRGEPGIGKSQLARAAAKELGRAYLKYVVDSHTEARDLMWTFDAVKRLADAQVAGARKGVGGDLAVRRYLQPGPLWWAFSPDYAARQAQAVGARAPAQPDGGKWSRGCVFLLDEIDKAEAEVPNGLLEALGAREFTPFGYAAPVRLAGPPPLVVITTNEERTLPDAFQRRCFVLPLALPKDDDKLKAHLMKRGRRHFLGTDEKVLEKAAELLVNERRKAITDQVTARPGQAEYLDLLRAVRGLASDDVVRQLDLLDEIGEFTMRKHAVDEDSLR